MSQQLPPTKTEPVKSAVADVARTVQAGQPPTNEQVNRVLEHTAELIESKKNEAPLNPRGQQLAEEVKTVISDVEKLISEKNKDEQVQRLITSAKTAGEEISTEVKQEAKGMKWEAESKLGPQVARTAFAASAAAKETVGTVIPLSKEALEEAKKQAKALADSARELALELIRSREFRSMMIEAMDLLQEALESFNEKAQSALQQTSEALQKGTEKAKEATQEARGRVERGELPSAEEVKGKAQKKGQELKQQAQQKGQELKEKAQQKGEEVKQKAQEKGEELKAKGEELKEQAQQQWESVKQSGQEKLGELKENWQQTVEEVKAGQVPSVIPLSDERREQIRRRINNLVRRMGRNENYRKAVNNLFALLDTLKGLADSARQRNERLVDSIKANPNLREAWDAAQSLISEFAGGYDMNRLWDALYRWFELAQSDTNIRKWWSDLRGFLNDTFERPEEDLAKRQEQLNKLIDDARLLAENVRYDETTREVLFEFRRVVDAIQNDPTTNKLVTDLQTLFRDLLLDAKGNLTFKAEELNQFKILITSLILEELKYIPVPEMRGATDEYEFRIYNAHFYGFDLLPEHVVVKFEAGADLNLKDISTRAQSQLTIIVSKIKCHMRNVNFWFRKKSGIVRMQDSGIADVDLAGDGATVMVRLLWDADATPSFRIRDIDIDIDKFRVHIVDSKYDWLLNLFSPLLSNDIKRSIEREVESRLRRICDRVFMNIRMASARIAPAVEKAGEIVKEQLRDVQMTKDRLETA